MNDMCLTVGDFKKVIAESIAKCCADMASARLEYPALQTSELMLDSPMRGGAEFVLPDGRRIPRNYAFIDVPADDRSVYYAVRHLIMRDVCTLKRGRVWFHGEPCHVVSDDGLSTYVGPDGGLVVRIRTLFYHEADAQ